jgi:hypothetical protein
MPDEQPDQCKSRRGGRDRSRISEAALVARLGDAVQEEGDSGGEQDQSAQVEPLAEM